MIEFVVYPSRIWIAAVITVMVQLYFALLLTQLEHVVTNFPIMPCEFEITETSTNAIIQDHFNGYNATEVSHIS